MLMGLLERNSTRDYDPERANELSPHPDPDRNLDLALNSTAEANS
jgi:hypothetical protein